MRKIHLTKEKIEICKITDKKFPDRYKNKFLIDNFNITYEEYLIKYYLDNKIPMCQCGCGTKVKIKFYNNTIHIPEYTKNHFPRGPHSDETKRKIKINTKKAIKEKYGVENVFVLKTIKEKIKNTNLEKYGVENVMQNDNIKNKNKHLQSEETKEKIKNTNKIKYGNNSFTSSKIGKEKIKNIVLEKYGVDNVAKLDKIKNKIKNTNIEKYEYDCNFKDPSYRKKYNNKTSLIEKYVYSNLDNAEHKFIYENKEFDIKLNNSIFEIEGEFYHPRKINNLTLIQINSLINDKIKYDLIKNSKYNLYKIQTNDLPEIISEKSLIKNSYIPHYKLNYKDAIINKEYFKNYINKKGKDKLEKYVPLLLKFIRNFQPHFPEIETNETLDQIKEYITNFDYDDFINSNIINNTKVHHIGNSYLKSKFKSYWKSKYINNDSPYNLWYNNKIMKKIIKYRIGINNSNEIFDFSLHQIIRGLSSYRQSISFFKPLLASIIYKKYLGNKKSPLVIDPCAGFGGRMIGFKSLYPNGTYIGIEPNIETYKELLELSKNFTKVKLYNCKLEDYQGKYNSDLTFTSIPYFNTEIYSNNKNLEFNEWKNMMNFLLKNYKNLIINLSEESYNLLKFNYLEKIYLQLNTSHFNKKSNIKNELILKI